MALLLGLKKIPAPPVEIDYVDLRLAAGEADLLYDLLCKVGGSPTTSRRQYAASLLDTLHEVYPGRDCQAPDDLEGRIYLRGGEL